MKFTLFRIYDALELIVIYLIVFSTNIFFLYIESISSVENSMLYEYLETLLEFRIYICIALTSIAAVFQYQFLKRKTIEVHCRIIVGDTYKNIITRNTLHNLLFLLISFLLSIILNVVLDVKISANIYVGVFFLIYILIAMNQVKK